MIAPGGIYEALIAKQGLRRIPWERRKGFVELAVKTKTPIVPTYCRGINSVYWFEKFNNWRLKVWNDNNHIPKELRYSQISY